MAHDIFPLQIWPENAQQARFPANDNALAMEAALAHALTFASSAPGSPTERDQHVVSAAWGGFAEYSIVIYLGGTWQEFLPFEGQLKRIAGSVYEFDGSDWVAFGGGGGGSTSAPLVTESGSNYDFGPGDEGKYVRFTGTGAKTASFDTADGFAAPEEYHVANRAASGNLTLTPTGITLNAPKGGTLVLAPGDTVTVKFVSSSVADVFGSTEDAP